MNWLSLVAMIPWEKVVLRPKNNTKQLDELRQRLEAASHTPNEAVKPSKFGSAIELPTKEETLVELKRRLAKELYRAELDLSGKLRIAGKPCDCLEDKHTLGLEAAAEELIAQEPGNPIYFEILQWIKNNRPKVTIEAIESGKYDSEYSRMAAEFKGFRKALLGSTRLSAMIAPKESITLEEAKKMAADPKAEAVAVPLTKAELPRGDS